MKKSGPMRGAEGAINAAAASQPHTSQRTRPNVGGVGSEKPASPKVVQGGGSVAEAKGVRASLGAATAELRSQHPYRHDDHGPHHGGTAHVRHRPHVKPGDSV